MMTHFWGRSTDLPETVAKGRRHSLASRSLLSLPCPLKDRLMVKVSFCQKRADREDMVGPWICKERSRCSLARGTVL